MSEVLFHGAKWVHIAAGVFAALFVFPLQFFASPGGPGHRGRRRLVVVVTLVIAVAGAAMLVNPDFSGFWEEESAKLGFETFFSTMSYEPLFFVFLDVTLLYLVLSAVHVWARDRGPDERPALPTVIDRTLAFALLSFCIAMVMLAIADWDTGFTWTRPYLFVGLLLGTVVVWDMSTWLPRFRPRADTWFRHHGARLMIAWAGLFYAVELRARIRWEWLTPRSHLIDLAWLALVALAFASATRRRRPATL